MSRSTIPATRRRTGPSSTRLAKENGLIVTGGTDYHGINTVTPRPVGAFTTSDEMIARIGDIAKARKSTYKRQK